MVEIEAGPELDRAVAEAIGVPCDQRPPYGLTSNMAAFKDGCYRCAKPWTEVKRCVPDLQHCVDCRREWEAEHKASQPPANYSTDLNAAFAAAETARLWEEQGLFFDLSTPRRHQWEVWHMGDIEGWSDGERPITQAPTPALAICAAILKLKEEK